MKLLCWPISASDRIPDRFCIISMEFLSLSRRRSFSRNVPQRRLAREKFCHSQASDTSAFSPSLTNSETVKRQLKTVKLLVKLSSLGVSSSALEWFRSYIHDRRQYILYTNCLWNVCNMCKFNLHTEFCKDLSCGRHYLMFASTICRAFLITAP